MKRSISKARLAKKDKRLTRDHAVSVLMELGHLVFDRQGKLASNSPELVKVGKGGTIYYADEFAVKLNNAMTDLIENIDEYGEDEGLVDFNYRAKFISASKFCKKFGVSMETLLGYVKSQKPCSYGYTFEGYEFKRSKTAEPINYYYKGKSLYIQVKSYDSYITEWNDLSFSGMHDMQWQSLSEICKIYEASVKQVKSLLVEERLIEVDSKWKITSFNKDFIKFSGKKMIVCVQNPFAVLPNQTEWDEAFTSYLHESLDGVCKRIFSESVKSKRTKFTKTEFLDRDLQQMKSGQYTMYTNADYSKPADQDYRDLSSYVFSKDYDVKNVRALFKKCLAYGCYVGVNDFSRDEEVSEGHFFLENPEDYQILLDFAFLGYSTRKPSANVPHITDEGWDSTFSTVIGMQRPICPFDLDRNQRLHQVLLQPRRNNSSSTQGASI